MSQSSAMVPSVVGGPESTPTTLQARGTERITSGVDTHEDRDSGGPILTETYSKNGVHNSISKCNNNSNKKVNVNISSLSNNCNNEKIDVNSRTDLTDSRTRCASESGVDFENCVDDVNLTKESVVNDVGGKLNGDGVVCGLKDPPTHNSEVEHDKTDLPEVVHLSKDQLLALSGEELWDAWLQQQRRCEALHERLQHQRAASQEADEGLTERLRNQLAEAQRKEAYHVMRLTTKEHELQEMAGSVAASKMFNLARCSLVDPAVNLSIERLKKDLEAARAKTEEAQNELAAWKFTPDSNTGKQLMAKCRLLIKENEELGRVISSDKLAKLEGDLALQRNFAEELKKSQTDLDEFMLEMDEDTEGMQGTILYQQQQLRVVNKQLHQVLNSVCKVCNCPVPSLIASAPSPPVAAPVVLTVQSVATEATAPVVATAAADIVQTETGLVNFSVSSSHAGEGSAPSGNEEQAHLLHPVKEETSVLCESSSLIESECPAPGEWVNASAAPPTKDAVAVLESVEAMIIPHHATADQPDTADHEASLTNGGKKRALKEDDVDTSGIAEGADGGVREPLCKRTKVTLLGEGSACEEDGPAPLLENGVDE